MSRDGDDFVDWASATRCPANAVQVEWAKALADFMREFAKASG